MKKLHLNGQDRAALERLRPKKPDFDVKANALRNLCHSYGVAHLYYKSPVSKSTIYKFLRGETKRPLGTTRDALAGAIGMEYKLTRKR